MPSQEDRNLRRPERNWITFGVIAGAAAGVCTGVAVDSWVFLIRPLDKMDFSYWVTVSLVHGAVVGCLGGGFLGLVAGSVLEALKRRPRA